MCIALIGGMDRLERHYLAAAEQAGITLKIFNRAANFAEKLKQADAVVIFTNKISHQAKNEAVQVAKARGIPILMQHACGVCSFRNCLECCSRMDAAGACPGALSAGLEQMAKACRA